MFATFCSFLSRRSHTIMLRYALRGGQSMTDGVPVSVHMCFTALAVLWDHCCFWKMKLMWVRWRYIVGQIWWYFSEFIIPSVLTTSLVENTATSITDDCKQPLTVVPFFWHLFHSNIFIQHNNNKIIIDVAININKYELKLICAN